MGVLRDAAAAVWRFRDSRKGFLVLWLLILVFLGKAAVDGYARYEDVAPAFDTGMFLAASGFLLLKSFLMPSKWYYLLRAHGGNTGFLRTGRIFYISQLSSYIPGGVWQYLEMGYRAAQGGEDRSDIAHSIVFLHGATVSSALAYGLVAAAVVFPAYAPVLLGAALAVFLLTVFAADILEGVKDRVDLGELDLAEYRPSHTDLAVLFAISTALWILNGAFFYFLAATVTAVTPSLFIPLSGVLAVSWAAGFLVLVVPGGLGVREGSMIYLLANLVPFPVAVTISVVTRILMLAAEILMAALYAALDRWST